MRQRKVTASDKSIRDPIRMLNTKLLRLIVGLGAGALVCAGALLAVQSMPSARKRPVAGPRAYDYPAFRGTDGLATVRNARLAADWKKHPPREMWRIEVGAGWGAFAVAGGCAFTQEQRGANEVVVCYDVATGRELWAHADPAHFCDPEGGDGPRATPTIVGDCVFSVGALGQLNCLDIQTGETRWSADILTYNGADTPSHGVSGSPLVTDELVVVSAGGIDGRSLVAYERQTGRRVWQGGNDPISYGSPLVCKLAGARQVIIVNQPGVAAHDLQSGAVLWTFPWENSVRNNCSQPVPLGGGRLFVSSGYGRGCCVLQLQRNGDLWSAEPIWTAQRMNTKFTSVVVRDQFAFGLDNGILSCLDLSDGSARWKAGRYGNGQILLAGDLLVIQAEAGEVAIVEAAPDGYRELARYPALSGKTWNHPALAGRLLLLRNDHEAACYELPLRTVDE